MFSLLSQSLSEAALCGESARPLRKLSMWLATSMPHSMVDACLDLRGVPPGERCTLVLFRRELLPIFSASTMEVGVADASADEQRREGIGAEGDSICLHTSEGTIGARVAVAGVHLDLSSVSKLHEAFGDCIAVALCRGCGFDDDAVRGCWFGGKLKPRGGGVGGGGGGGGGAAAVNCFGCSGAT